MFCICARVWVKQYIYIRGTHNQRHVLNQRHTKHIRCHCKQSSNVNKQQQIHRILFINLQHEWWVAIFPHKTHTQNPKWDRFTMQAQPMKPMSFQSKLDYYQRISAFNFHLSARFLHILIERIYFKLRFASECVAFVCVVGSFWRTKCDRHNWNVFPVNISVYIFMLIVRYAAFFIAYNGFAWFNQMN